MFRYLITSLILSGFIGFPLIAGAPVKDYADRLDEAIKITEGLTEGDHTVNEVLTAMVKIKGMLPESEDVELDGQNIHVNNAWLHLSISEVINNADGDVEQRRSMLIDMANRLDSLRQLVGGPSERAGADDQRARLDLILSRPEYRPDELKESSFQYWMKRIINAIVRLLSHLVPVGSSSAGGAGAGTIAGFRIVILLFVLGAALFGILQLLKMIRRRKTEKDESVREVLGEEIDENITASDLINEATELARQGDYRMAIRRAYIAILFELENRGRLRLHRSKTNRDYLDALKSEQDIFFPFNSMTGTFERVWYGQNRANEDDFNGFIARYEETLLTRATP